MGGAEQHEVVDVVSADAPRLQEGERALLKVRGLSVDLPDGRKLLNEIDLDVRAGEIVAILGPSGSGKSTLGRALFEPALLTRVGMRVRLGSVEMAGAALVPQTGAPFDHLDVVGNVALVQRWHGLDEESPGSYLASVGLGGALLLPGASTRSLSGGQSQRLAVARALAAGRDLLFLDEPSAGLDARAVAELAEVLREEVAGRGGGAVLVTHDTLLAASAADRCLLLDPETGSLVPLADERVERGELESWLREKLDQARCSPSSRRARSMGEKLRPALRDVWERTLASLVVPPLVLASLLSIKPRHLPSLLRVASRVALQAVVRPAAFYAVVSSLLGFTVLYVLVRAAPAGLSPAVLLELVGGSYVLALAPPLSALLFVATSGSAVSAWLGSLSLSRQISALQALGIPARVYLWVPVFIALACSFLLVSTVVSAGLLFGGTLLHHLEGIADTRTLALLAGDLLDPVPERASLRTRAFWLLFIYAPGIASDVVQRGTTPKDSSDAVTRGMTGSVVACTLWVVLLELVSSLFLFAGEGARLL